MDLFSPWHLLIILIIVVLIFGTKKLRNMGSDVGGAVKEFKKAVRDETDAKTADPKITDPIQPAIDPTQPPADITRVQRPPPAPGDDPLARG